jgi:hypothetical protein
MLSPQVISSTYQLLIDELVKRGGFWQVDMGGILTINLPKDLEVNINQVIKELRINLTKIVDEE